MQSIGESSVQTTRLCFVSRNACASYWTVLCCNNESEPILESGVAQRDNREIATRLKEINDLISGSKHGESFPVLLKRLTEARQVFHELLAARFTAELNEHLQQAKRDSIEDRRNAALDISTALNSLGLAIRCPKTGEPALLRAETGRAGSGGHFQLRLIGEMNQSRTLSFATPVDFELMPSPAQVPNVAHRRQWPDRVRIRPGTDRDR